MAAVSILEGNVEHRFNVPEGYKPVINNRGHGELIIDPDYRSTPEVSSESGTAEQMGQVALVLATEADSVHN